MDSTVLGSDDAPRAARRAVAECCTDADAGPVCAHGSALMTSELVTNAVRHAGGDVTFGVDCNGHNVRVEVSDDDNSHPQVRSADDDREGGRGMAIIDALASDWGVTDDAEGGKTVWFEIPTQP